MAEISVIMPVYNAEKFLQAAIDSILQQTFSDFEFLICDDCSDDRSAEILQSAAVNDSRIKLLHNEKNSGVTLSLNKLLKAASAPLIARMDADDIAVPERLQWQFDFMQQHPEIAVAGGDLEIIDEGTNTLARRYYRQSPQDIRRGILCSSPVAHPSVMMRAKEIQRLGGYIELAGCEDYYLWLRCVENGLHLANLPQILLRYRLSANQIKQRNMKKSLRSTIAVQKKYIFKRDFFSIKALCVIIAEHILLMLPNKLILMIFQKVAYR